MATTTEADDKSRSSELGPEVFDDFVEPFHELGAAVGFERAGGGFDVVEEQCVERGGVLFRRYAMRKSVATGGSE